MPVPTLSVWHAKEPNWGDSPIEWAPENYEMVAILVAEFEGVSRDLDDAFQLTNHITIPWWDNEGVELVGPAKRRSTSCGDVVFFEGVAYLCDRIGWKALAKEAA